MVNSPAHDSARIMSEARHSLVRQQAGGRRSIGRRSAELKRQHLGKKAARMAMAVGVLMVGAMAAGIVLDGIGMTGVMVLALSIVAALWFFGTYPKMKVPDLAALNTGDVRTMVGRTELWLEAQRPVLPAPAVQLVDQIGIQDRKSVV